MKLCILGGGGFRTPYVYQALLRDQGTPRVEEVALYDTDQDRLDGMVLVLSQFAREFPDAPRLVPTTSLDQALAGSDFIFAAVRVGGLAARCCDERVALDLNVIGQETTGPGGLAYALRTVPFMVDIAHKVRELAPNAYFLNFTNPAGIITEAMQGVLGDRVLGICDTPSGLGRRVAGVLGLDHRRVQMDYVGLNHLGWMRRVLYDGVDVLPTLLADDEKLSVLEEGIVFGPEWLRTMGLIPNEYLYYYYFNRDAVRAIVDSGTTRGEFLLETQDDFYREVRSKGADAAAFWRETVTARSASYMAEAKGGEQGKPAHTDQVETDPSHQGYAGVALGVMAAITRNERATMILNVRNRGTIAGMPDDAVVEVPTTVDANGVHPLTTSAPSLHQLGLMQQVKAVERHTIAAALTGDRNEALQAFALHPLVDSVTVGRKLLDGYVDRIPEVAAVLGAH
ncbi:6-phospho-beta-glucosidase [Kineococcus sp. GCM10028916]|uniref:6-phospho-beta-glucosidase n=1 Tax=Kineococcus sp. GCM10028916 TaxID=3273394 RepID=UPI0036440A55